MILINRVMNFSHGRIQRALYDETALPRDELTGVPPTGGGDNKRRGSVHAILTAGSGSVHVPNVQVGHQPITDW